MAVVLFVVNLPINGLLLLGIYHVYCRTARDVAPVGRWPFLATVLLVAVMITIIGAVLDLLLLTGPDDTVLLVVAILGGALLIGAINAAIAGRFLRLSTSWSLAIMLAFFMLNLAFWSSLVGEGLGIRTGTWTLILVLNVLFLIALVLVAHRYRSTGHSKEIQHGAAIGVDGGTPPSASQHDEAVRLRGQALWSCLAIVAIACLVLLVL